MALNLPRFARLLLIWLAIQWVVCFLPVLVVYRSYRECENSPSCRVHLAEEWDARRSLAAVVWVQFIQPIGSALLFSLVPASESRPKHIAKGIGIGLAAMIVGCLTGWLIYTYYPRPGYWSLGNIAVEVYLTIPVIQALSALIGGTVCGLVDGKRGPG